MKKFLLTLTVALLSIAAFSQNEKYVKAMEGLVPAIDTTRSREGCTELANAFERIANVEKTQWLPYYYAALANVNAGYTYFDASFGDKSSEIDPIADKAEGFLKQAEALSKDNSEIWVVKKMLITLRLLGNPMARGMELGPQAAAALETAKKLNPENPRVHLQEGIDKSQTPEQWGGSKDEGKKMLETAVQKYEAFKPESSIHPNWGLGTAKYFISTL